MKNYEVFYTIIMEGFTNLNSRFKDITPGCLKAGPETPAQNRLSPGITGATSCLSNISAQSSVISGIIKSINYNTLDKKRIKS